MVFAASPFRPSRMPILDDQTSPLIPSWIFEQDYLVFLSFFGWMLVGLLAWTKPLSEGEERRLPWLWIGYYAFSQAMSDFLRALSFSDPFFRVFNLEVGFEMLGYGLLVEAAIRYSRRFRNRTFFPWAAVGGLFLGLSIEIGDVFYTVVVSFCVAMAAVFLASRALAQAAKRERRPELYALVASFACSLPAWLLVPGRLSMDATASLWGTADYPYFGFGLLFLRILAAWIFLAGFWRYRLQGRVEDVAPQSARQLRFWGYRVLPLAVTLIVLASYKITSWNGERMRDRMESDYLFRAQTAALSMQARDLADFEYASQQDPTATRPAWASQLLAIRRIGTDVRSVYLWLKDSDEGARTISITREQGRPPSAASVFGLMTKKRRYIEGEPFLFGPLRAGDSAVLSLNSPIIDRATGEPAYWLGIDMSAEEWFLSISLSRLQTIIIAGLVLALVIFFLYYQIDHESEADLILAKERAEAADRAKSEFLAVISHEIRTPLQSVLGYSDLLRSTPLNEKQQSCVDTIQSEGKILLRIVQDILDFSNLRKASFELKQGPVPLLRLIEETFRTIKPMAVRKGLAASLSVDPSVPAVVMADGVRLRQVLLNLFGNSVKYTEEGSVTLKASYGQDSYGTSLGRPLVFEISDTGVGIRKEDLGRLFEPFVQLEHSSKFPREGAGLGLAIVARIVELMGGRIGVVSEIGKGSKFTVAFDFETIAADAAEAAEPDRPTPSSIAREAGLGKRFPLRVAVVDDNPMVRRLVAQYLESLGYEPELLDGGRPASEQGHLFDLILLDLRMPDIDGPAAATLIRERCGDPDRPWIVAVSASLQEAEVERARSAGVNDFLGKPFFAAQLAERIRAMPWFSEVEPEATERPPGSGDSVHSETLESVVESAAREDESPATGSVDVEEAPSAAQPAAAPASVFAGVGGYAPEAVRSAVAEVYELHDRMLADRLGEDAAAIRETAHYLANTAMALGIDQLYLDSKDLQAAAEAVDWPKIDALLPELRLNFEAWEKDD